MFMRFRLFLKPVFVRVPSTYSQQSILLHSSSQAADPASPETDSSSPFQPLWRISRRFASAENLETCTGPLSFPSGPGPGPF